MRKTPFQIALLLCGPALFLAWAHAQSADNPFGFSLASDLEMLQVGQHISAQQAVEFEEELRRHPDDFKTRALLTAYYYRYAMREQRLKHALWLIEHHPESQLLNSTAFIVSAENSPINDMASYQRTKQLWLAISRKDQQNPETLWNVASFLLQFDPLRAEQLALQGKALEPRDQRWTDRLAFLYSKAVFTGGRMRPQMPATPERVAFAKKARRQLEISSDPNLIGIAGNSLAPSDLQARAMRSADDIAFGLKLLKRARQLAPNDPRWDAYLQAFTADETNDPHEPDTAAEYDVGPRAPNTAPPGTLLRRVEAEYSPAALSARIQGTILLRILIGTDGHVLNAWLVSGHPLLYTSAYKAVKRWRYEPLRIGNDPVEAYHVVQIQFRLP